MKKINAVVMDVNVSKDEVVFTVAGDTDNGISYMRLWELTELDRETVRKFIAENIKTIEWFGSTDTWDRYIIKPVTEENNC